jgi:hypothetical protein
MILCLSACSDQSSLSAPTGSVTIDSYYEASSGGTKGCIITLKIANNGTTKITTSTITYSVKTNERTYKVTSVFQAYILAGQSIYESPSVTYYDATETTSLADITILNSAFE